MSKVTQGALFDFRKSRPIKIRRLCDTRLKRLYGISKFDYNERLHEQDGACPICLKKFQVSEDGLKPISLCVDHDHTTGKVRGLLCNKCNPALGLLEDNPLLLIRAIRYLERDCRCKYDFYQYDSY